MILTVYRDNIDELVELINDGKLDRYLVNITMENIENKSYGNYQNLQFGYKEILRTRDYVDYDDIHSKVYFHHRKYTTAEEYYKSN